MLSFKGRHRQQDMIPQCVRWYVAYSLNYRDWEEMMHERGYGVDHSTIQRWVVYCDFNKFATEPRRYPILGISRTKPELP